MRDIKKSGMKFMKLYPFALLAAVLSGCAMAPAHPGSVRPGDEDAVKAYLTKLINHEMSKSDVPGLSIAIVDDQRVVWSQGFGYADQERRILASPETIYRVGSISKLFTDMAAMQLVEQGKLNLDVPLKTYLPNFSIKERAGDAVAITPRMLMTHHSGLPRDILKGFMTTTPEPFSNVVDKLRDEFADYSPGQTFSYSNVGVSVLGCVIQQVSGEPFADRLKKEVLLPMGMSHSAFETGVSSSEWMAKGYQGDKPSVEPSLRDVPAGGLNASVVDMTHFMSTIFAGGVHDGHRILQPETLAEMLQPQNLNVPLDMNFQVGLGWMLSTFGRNTIQGGGVVAHHAGATRLFHSQIYILPEHKLGVVVLANSNAALQVVDHIATEALALELEAKTGIKQPGPQDVPTVDQPDSSEDLAKASGRYTTIVGPVNVSAQDGRLRAEVADHTLNLNRRVDGRYSLDYALLGIFHIKLGTLSELGLSFQQVAGHDALIARHGAQEMLVGDKVLPPASLGDWHKRLGDYEIVNLGNDVRLINSIRLAEDHGYLMLELTMSDNPYQTERSFLMPKSNVDAVLLGTLRDGGANVKVVPVDGEERLEISGYQVRRIAN